MSQTPIKELLIATKNAGKVEEFRLLLATAPLKLRYLRDFPDVPDVDETGTTFQKNAALKASEYARLTGLWSVADDSGLEVDALGGEPGVYSARYGGAEISSEERMSLVLERLGATDDRSARFVCVVALAAPSGEIVFTAEGECRGTIAEAPGGSLGFGYDPIFVPNGWDRTFGELPEAVKRQISHRARAATLLIRYLLHFDDARLDERIIRL